MTIRSYCSALCLLVASAANLLTGCSASAPDRNEVVADMRVLFENDYARVQWHDVNVGETVPMHSDPPSVMIVFNDSRVRFHLPNGDSSVGEGKLGEVRWSEGVSHAVENIGTAEVHNLVIEMKDRVPMPSEAPKWGDEFLPLAAAPEQHALLLENRAVNVYEVVNPPGGIAPAHVHLWPSLFITVSPARLVFRDAEGNVVADVPGVVEGEALPRVQWFGPSAAPRSVENVDSVTLRAYRIEFKPDAER